MLNLNSTTLEQVVANAKHLAHADARWLNAIDRAAGELATNPYVERQASGELLIGSPSGNVYSTSSSCSCTAAQYGRPCWHRAAARLVTRYDERQAQPAPTPTEMAARIARARAEAEQARQALLECWS